MAYFISDFPFPDECYDCNSATCKDCVIFENCRGLTEIGDDRTKIVTFQRVTFEKDQ